MKSLCVLLITLILVPFLTISADYIWPLPVSKELTSNFCSFRGGHYHAGIDIRTFGKTGYKVVAVDDGYLWRVGSNWWGYGNVVYLRLDDGNIAVYGHLSEFTTEVEEYIRSEQHKAGRYKVNLYPEKDRFRFKKGDLIGKSGQSGSGAPHLHFEIRDPENNPLHPFRFYPSIKDTRAPRFEEITFRPLEGVGSVNGGYSAQSEKLHYDKNHSVYITNKTQNMTGKVGIEIKVADYLNNHNRKFNVTDIKLYLDDTLRFHSSYDSLSFDTWNLVDLDYNHYQRIKNKNYYHNLYYPDGIPSGQFERGSNCPTCRDFTLNEDTKPGLHELRIVASDYRGNSATAIVPIEILPVPKLQSDMNKQMKNGTNFDFFDNSEFVVADNLGFTADISVYDADSAAFIKIARVSSETDGKNSNLPLERIINAAQIEVSNFNLLLVDFLRENNLFYRGLIGYFDGYHSNYIDSKYLDKVDYIKSVEFISSHPQVTCNPLAVYNFFTDNDIQASFVQPLLPNPDKIAFALNLKQPSNGFLEGFYTIPNLINDLVIRKLVAESYIYHKGKTTSVYMTPSYSISIPEEIPADLFFKVDRSSGLTSGPTLVISPDDRLFVDDISLGVKLPANYPEDKTGLFAIDREGKPTFAGNEIDSDGYMSAEYRSYGTFELKIDKNPPQIYNIYPKNGSSITNSRPRIHFVMKDEPAGFDSDTLLNVSLDGRWQVSEYDVDNEIVYVHIDKPLTPGKHELVIHARDLLGNLAVKKSVFRYTPSSKK